MKSMVFHRLFARISLTATVSILITLFPWVASYAVPTSISISTITPGNGYLEVAFSGASGATSIEYSTDGGISWNDRFTGISAGSSSVWSPLTIHGLTNGETYSVKLRGKNGDGTGTESSAVSGTPNANSRISANHAHLQGAYVEVGVRPNGAFGSSAGSLYGFHSSVGACLGFRVDRQKNGWGSSLGNSTDGFTNIDDGDYFCPGSPYEGWSLKVGSSGAIAFNSDQGTAIQGNVYGLDKNDTDQRVFWSGSAYDGIVVTQTSIVGNTSQSLHVDIELRNSSASTIENIFYGRGYDPDNSTGSSSGAATSGSRNKVNNPGGDGQIAEVQASFDSGAIVYLRSTDSRARAAARLSNCCTASVASPWEIWNTSDYWSQSTTELSSADRQVGVAVKIDSLAAGETTTFRISYVLTTEDASSPSVTTGSATNVGATSTATLNGSVNANGQASSVEFEYGTSSDLSGDISTVNASESPISGSSNSSVSANLSGLTQGTTYYYRVKAQNETGTSRGSIQSFTPIADPDILIEAANDLAETTATLNGFVNANGGTVGSIFFLLDTNNLFSSGNVRTLPANPDSVSGTTLTAVSYSVGSLDAGQTYYFKLTGSNEASSQTSSVLQFTTTPAPLVTVGSATSKDVAARTIDLNASINTYGTQTGSLYFEISTSNSFTSGSSTSIRPTIEFIGAGSTGVIPLVSNASGLALGTTYYYRLFAGNTSGANYTTSNSFILASAPTVTTGSASTAGTTASLTGSVNPNGANTSAIRFYYATSAASIGSSTAYVTASPSSAVGNSESSVTGTISGLTAGSTYYYRIMSTNSEGTNYGDTGSFTLDAADTTPPEAVIVVASTGTTASTLVVVIQFGESTTGFTNTDLVLSGSSGGWTKSSATATGSAYEITLTPSAGTGGGSLKLNVPAGAAQDTSRNLSLAATEAVVTITDTRSVPGAPTIGTAVSTGSTSATLTFSAPASNGGSTITSYKAYTSTGSYLDVLSQAGSGTFTLTGLNTGSTYAFYVTAINSLGESSPSSNSNSITLGITIADPETGLLPIFDTPVSTPGGFTVNVTNYNLNFSWTVSVSGGYTALLESGGLITVSGISNTGYEATLTVTTSRAGYTSRSASITGTSRGASPEVNFREIVAPTISVSGNEVTCTCGEYRYVSRGWIERASDINAVLYVLYLDNEPIALSEYDPKEVMASWLAPALVSKKATPTRTSKDSVAFEIESEFRSARCEIFIFESPTLHLAKTATYFR